MSITISLVIVMGSFAVSNVRHALLDAGAHKRTRLMWNVFSIAYHLLSIYVLLESYGYITDVIGQKSPSNL